MSYYGVNITGFEAGMRVKVSRQRKYKSYNLANKIGTVTHVYGGDIRVKFDDLSNRMSASGDFYFKASELCLINVDDNNIIMEENNTMSKITNYLNAVKIQYVDGSAPSSYIYANFEPDLKVGDLCVIQSAHHGLGLARVTEVIESNNFDISSREVVAKVYDDFYKERVTNRKKAAEIKAKMQERAKQLQDIALYQMLAKDDPEMMELLNAYHAVPQM